MKQSINAQYRIGTFFALFTTVAYGVMRLIEGDSYISWEDHGTITFFVSMCVAVVILIEQMLLRNFTYTPLVIIGTMTVSFGFGSYFSTEWDYYYVSSIGMVGLICIYGKIRPVLVYQALNIVQNIIVLNVLGPVAPDGFVAYMLTSFLVFFFSSIYVIILFFLAYKKEGVAQSGLQAFSSLLGSTPNLMVIIDDKRRVRYISAPLARFAGMDEKAAIGRPLVDMFKTESLKLMFADILDAENFYSATREIDMNDEPRYFKIIADKLSGDGAGMFIEITDMTEIVLASIKAEEARKEAEIANNSKSTFLTTMSHEIRTPMNAIIGVSEIQLSRNDLPSDAIQALRQIHASGHGLLGIINDILDLSKIETGKLEISSLEYDMASLINDAVQLNIVRVGSKPIKFVLEVDENLPARMVGDEIRIKQVLNNVLSNAFKYTEEGTVTLSISHREVRKGIELTLKVSDTGQGMKPEDLARLFDEYSRFNTSANRLTEGTGLGMNITQRLVHMMDGEVAVESEYGKGSTFTITILQQPSQNKCVIGREHAKKLRDFTFTIDRELSAATVARDYMPYGRVLVVDDVETNLYVARGLLTPYGLTIDVASGGYEAIEKIADNEEYDIVFMDHMMPQLDGVETTKKLRESGYKGTIVALTANAIAGNDKFFKENGFDDFISKPIDMRHMNLMLNQYVRDKRNAKAAPVAPVAPAAPAAPKVDQDLLEIFKRDARKAITTLSESAKNGDYKLYATTAHAMKSATLNVGENEISELAKSLEDAGNAHDQDFIETHNVELIYALAKIAGEDESVSPDVRTENAELLREKLSTLYAACDEYDGSAARTILKELRDLAGKAETIQTLDEISEMVLCSDFEEAADKAAALAGRV